MHMAIYFSQYIQLSTVLIFRQIHAYSVAHNRMDNGHTYSIYGPLLKDGTSILIQDPSRLSSIEYLLEIAEYKSHNPLSTSNYNKTLKSY